MSGTAHRRLAREFQATMPPDSSPLAAATTWNPRRILNFLVLAILVSSSFLNNWEYRRGWLSDPSSYMDIAAGNGRAPDQYRIGVIDPAEYVAVHRHIALRNVLSTIDSLAEAVALLLLLSLFRNSKTYANATPIVQLAGELSLLFLAEFYLSWLFWYHRPETLAAAALVACWLALLTRLQSTRTPQLSSKRAGPLLSHRRAKLSFAPTSPSP